MSPEDDSDNLQLNMQLQPLATTSTSSGAFGPLDTSTTGMFKIIMLTFTYDICVYIFLISQIMKINYLILYKRINYVSYNFILTFRRFSSSKKKTRGPTCNLDLLGMKPDEKESTHFNTKGQVVYHDNGERISSYMGTLVRSQHNVPIQVQNRHHVSKDVNEKLWVLILVCQLLFI